MKINYRCRCGATFSAEDDSGIPINDDGKSDKKGRRFVIEKKADEWIELHKKCMEKDV